MKQSRILVFLSLILIASLLTSCSSSDDVGESQESLLEVLETVKSVETSILLELDVHTGTSGLPGSHTASINSDVTLSAHLNPISYYGEYFSRIVVDGVNTREDRKYYVLPAEDEYHRYEYVDETDTWTVSTLTKAQEMALPLQTGFITNWPELMETLQPSNEKIDLGEDVSAVVYSGEVKTDIFQDLFGNNIFGSFLYSMEYLLTDEIPCKAIFDEETGMPLELHLDISQSFIVEDMTVDYGVITVKYSNINHVDEIEVPKQVTIVASDPAQEFYRSYYLWNLFLPYMNTASSVGTIGNTGLSFESKWNTFQVRIDDGMTALPLNYSDLNNIGYILSGGYLNGTLEPNKYEEFIPLTKGSDTLYCTFYNDQTTVQPYSACKVVALDLRASDCPSNSIQMYLPGEITMGVTRDALLSAYGQPDSETNGFSTDTYVWYNTGADGVSIMQQSFTAEISLVSGKLSRMYLKNIPVNVLGLSATTNPSVSSESSVEVVTPAESNAEGSTETVAQTPAA